ncbi:hypothetical protein OEZ60_13675 [Defluviimonas sp. WL0024]|nr:hypothetical protein [Defluviimonas salinarum]MCU9849052.1 hypothetical protein [Defluviimonas sp. WL0024]
MSLLTTTAILALLLAGCTPNAVTSGTAGYAAPHVGIAKAHGAGSDR